MTDYAIPTIKGLPQFQRQLNTLLGAIGDTLEQLTAAYLTDELSVPLQTEAAASLELDP